MGCVLDSKVVISVNTDLDAFQSLCLATCTSHLTIYKPLVCIVLITLPSKSLYMGCVTDCHIRYYNWFWRRCWCWKLCDCFLCKNGLADGTFLMSASLCIDGCCLIYDPVTGCMILLGDHFTCCKLCVTVYTVSITGIACFCTACFLCVSDFCFLMLTNLLVAYYIIRAMAKYQCNHAIFYYNTVDRF